MWYREHSVVVKTTKEAVWQMWADPELWAKYDPTISEAAFQGDFAVGVAGKMKAKNTGKVIDFSITELAENERMTVQVKKFGARILGIHMVDDAEEGVKITFRVELRGIFSWFHRSSVSKGIGGAVETIAENMAKAALELAKKTVKADESESGSDDAVAEPSEPETEESVAAPESDIPEGIEGDPIENEKRKKDIHTQIEEAAAAEVPEVKRPEPLIDDEPKQEAETKEEAVVEEPVKEEEASTEDPKNDAPTVEATEEAVEKPVAKKKTVKKTVKKAVKKEEDAPAEKVDEAQVADAAAKKDEAEEK